MLWVLVAIVVVVGIVVAVFGWDRYRGTRAAAGDGTGAEPTAEVFVDPDTGGRLRVWYDRGTGRRDYRPEQPGDEGRATDLVAVESGTDQADRGREADVSYGSPRPAGTARSTVVPKVSTALASGAETGMSATIEVTGLTKRFGETVAVHDLSFSVTAGRIVGFLGPNGAGKSTTLRVLLGLVRPTAGSATIDGRRYAELADPARTVGALLDGDDVHAGRSGRNHLRVLARAAGVAPGRADELLELVELTGAADRRAGGYSMGMRQRLGLAAALLGDPRVLVLDEPANGLDPQGIRWLRDFLRSLAGEGRAILVSSHVLAEISQTADDVIVINHGRSVLQAPLAELMVQRNGGMRVTGPDSGRLAELLSADGAQVEAAGEGAIVVADRTGEQIGRVIAAHGIVVSELAPRAASLEDVFFELTGAEGGPS
ncbi:MAG TPA: ATP-binding cassette domain-containing protein [Solirubrobacteraceae bacterium]|nr:ATP-binding cassette domain-containing protein [Solirubrobacteraceae bacterium]